MSSYLIDYFVTVGTLPNVQLQCAGTPLGEIYENAITDISIMMPGCSYMFMFRFNICRLTVQMCIDEMEVLESGWQIAETYLPEKDDFQAIKHSVYYPVVVFRRRKHSGVLGHITEVLVIQNLFVTFICIYSLQPRLRSKRHSISSSLASRSFTKASLGSTLRI
jgi:hypothetical protein